MSAPGRVPDHIIVGSGINALVCAAMLAGKGRKVLVLERNERIGGCIRTDEITVPGFVHDVMATTFVLFVTLSAVLTRRSRHGDRPPPDDRPRIHPRQAGVVGVR